MQEYLLKILIDIANERHDGHLTVMKFTTNWRVSFSTPTTLNEVKAMWVADTFEEVAVAAIASQFPNILKSDMIKVERLEKDIFE